MTDSTKPTTLYDKIWNDHLVHEADDGTCLLYIDRHLVHEVTSPQAFEGLRAAGRKVHAPEKTLAVVDHNVPTTDRSKPNPDPESAEQIAVLAENVREFGIEYYNEFDKRQGIVHVIGPEQGFTLPGTTIVCGDSHTSTHGAFGALRLNRPKMLNALSFGVFAEIKVAIDAFEADDAIGCIVLTGSEKAFAAGADIKEMQPKSFIDMYSRDFTAIGGDRVATCTKPTIAAVAGY
eukprot:gene4901-6666_t